MKKIALNLIGFVAGLAAMTVVHLAIYWAITFLAKIPIIGNILYYPSDSMTVRTVSCITASTFVGGICSTKICGNAKLFAATVITPNVLAIVIALATASIVWSTLWQSCMYIGVGVICWMLNRDAVNEM